MDDVFEAVADPTRRRLLDRLRCEGPLSVQQMSRPLPITRQAVSKHLGVLASAGLVLRERQGRRILHRLDPAPLRSLERWLEDYSAAWDRRLDRLSAHLEAPDGIGLNPARRRPAATTSGSTPTEEPESP